MSDAAELPRGTFVIVKVARFHEPDPQRVFMRVLTSYLSGEGDMMAVCERANGSQVMVAYRFIEPVLPLAEEARPQ